MADVNSLTYLIYSLLTLTPHDSPTTDPSLKAWERTSEPSLTTAWHQDPDPYTGNYAKVTRYNHRDRRTTYADEDYTDATPEPFNEVTPDEPDWSRETRNAKVTRYNHRDRRTTYADEDYTDATPEPFDEVTPDEPDWSRETRKSPVTRYNYRNRRTTYADEDYTDATPEPFDEVTPDEPDFSRETRTGDDNNADPDPLNPDKLKANDCSSICSEACQQRGFTGGICRAKNCICTNNSPIKSSTLDPDEINPYTSFPRVEPDEAKPVTYDPRNPDKLNSEECNPSNCDNGCIQKGYRSGLCYGPDKKICRCYKYIARNRYSTEDPDERAPPTRYYSLDPDEVDHTEDPRITFNPDEIGRAARDPESGILMAIHGCPSKTDCTQYCNQYKKKKFGSCQGYRRMECLCYDHW